MRTVLSVINLGNGLDSEREVESLVTRLRETFSLHSALSQGQDLFTTEDFANFKSEVRDLIEDIETAFGLRS